jgi:hypothetical protein
MMKKKGYKTGGKMKKGYKKGKVIERPTVVPPNDDRPPMTKEQLLEEERKRKENERMRVRPRKRPEGLEPIAPSGTPGSASPRQFQPPTGNKETQNKRGFTPGEQTPPNREEPGGTFLPPEIVGRSKKPDIGVLRMKGGGMTKKGYAAGGKTKGGAKGGKGKIRGSGIARKGVRPVKMR